MGGGNGQRPGWGWKPEKWAHTVQYRAAKFEERPSRLTILSPTGGETKPRCSCGLPPLDGGGHALCDLINISNAGDGHQHAGAVITTEQRFGLLGVKRQAVPNRLLGVIVALNHRATVNLAAGRIRGGVADGGMIRRPRLFPLLSVMDVTCISTCL